MPNRGRRPAKKLGALVWPRRRAVAATRGINRQALAPSMALGSRPATVLAWHLPLALLLLVSGCVGLAPSPAGLTAEAALAQGAGAAHAWAPDAEPVEVSAVGRPHPAAGDGSVVVGLDGRAATWVVTFHSPNRSATLEVLVLPEKAPTVTEPSPAANASAPLPTEATLDSPAALQAALTDDRFSRAAEAEDALLSMSLSVHDQRPRWLMMAWSEEAETTRILEVDALTGQLMGTGYEGG